MQKDV
jgi:hypothetical protein